MNLKEKMEKFLIRAKSYEDDEFREEIQLRMLKLLNFDTFLLARVFDRMQLDMKAILGLGYEEHDTFVLDDKDNFNAIYFKMYGDEVISTINYDINIIKYKGG